MTVARLTSIYASVKPIKLKVTNSLKHSNLVLKVNVNFQQSNTKKMHINPSIFEIIFELMLENVHFVTKFVNNFYLL